MPAMRDARRRSPREKCRAAAERPKATACRRSQIAAAEIEEPCAAEQGKIDREAGERTKRFAGRGQPIDEPFSARSLVEPRQQKRERVDDPAQRAFLSLPERPGSDRLHRRDGAPEQ